MCVSTCVYTYTQNSRACLRRCSLPPTKPIYLVLAHFDVIFWGSPPIIGTYGASFIDEADFVLAVISGADGSVWMDSCTFSQSLCTKDASPSCRAHFDSLCVHMKHLVAASREPCAIKTCLHQRV